MPMTTISMVAHRPANLPQMNSARPTGLEKRMKTVRFSTSLCSRLAATNTATSTPNAVTATRPKSIIRRPCWPRLMLASQRLATIIARAKRTTTSSTRSRIVSLNVLRATATTRVMP